MTKRLAFFHQRDNRGFPLMLRAFLRGGRLYPIRSGTVWLAMVGVPRKITPLSPFSDDDWLINLL
ncbi:hypothetical protein D3C86_1175660 [compost metagenome]